MEILDRWLAEGGAAEPLIAAWGRTHRFAGKKDRAAIADHVFAGLRRRASAAWLMGGESGRALVIGALARDGLDADAIAALLPVEPHAPEPLGAAERMRLDAGLPDDTPPWIAGDYPQALHAELVQSLGEALLPEMNAMAARAPLDLRVNALKATRAEAKAALAAEGIAAVDGLHAPHGLRAPVGAPVQRSRAFAEGLVEIQDEGSQLVSMMAGAEPGMTVIDLAAGAGGKALAFAAMMANRGRIVASDIAPERLARLTPRAERAGARIIETRVLKPWQNGPDPSLADLTGMADLVLIDAPCSGSGTWRRAPDGKWRLGPAELQALWRAQAGLLARAGPMVKPGGRLVYVTCSLLASENEAPLAAFLQGNPDFEATEPPGGIPGYRKGPGLLLTPARTGTDGFFCAILRRKAHP
jgi:16S rRNA (cytosine967-C5)-methyltransferase